MDPGWAVVLGALIALAGSSFVPWLREATTAARLERAGRTERLRGAVVDLLAANAAQGSALVLDNDRDLHVAFEARTRATARLLIEVNPADRRPLSDTINLASPTKTDTGERIRALQIVLTSWVGGDIAADDLESSYRQEFGRLKARHR